MQAPKHVQQEKDILSAHLLLSNNIAHRASKRAGTTFDSIALPDKSLQYHIADPLTTVSNSNVSSLATFQTPLEFETVATMSVAQEVCRGEIAIFFKSIERSKPWWYTVSGSGEWSISRLLRLDPLHAHALLLTAGLIKYKGDGFEVKADEWKKFASAYNVDIEVEKSGLPSKGKAWFIRLGDKVHSQHRASNQFQRRQDAENAKALADKTKGVQKKKRKNNTLGYDLPRLRLVSESRNLSEAVSSHVADEVDELQGRIQDIIKAFNGNGNLSKDLGKMSSLLADSDEDEWDGEVRQRSQLRREQTGSDGRDEAVAEDDVSRQGSRQNVVNHHSNDGINVHATASASAAGVDSSVAQPDAAAAGAADANTNPTADVNAVPDSANAPTIDPKKYPLLHSLGIDLNFNEKGESVGDFQATSKIGNLLRELYQYHDEKGKPMTFEWNHGGKGKLMYVPVSAKDSNNFHRSGMDRILIEGMLDQMSNGTEEEMEEAAVKVCSYFATNYQDALITAASDKGLDIANQIDATSAAAIMEDCNLNKTNATILFRHLRNVFGDKVCVALKEIWAVGEGYVKGDFGEFKYAKVAGDTPENCPYWTRKIENILENELARAMDNIAKPDDIEDIAIALGGDHGQGAFRALIKIIIRLKEGTGDKRKITRIVKTAHIDCKKDNGTIIKGTISTGIKDSVEKVAEGSLELVGGEAKFIEGRGAIAPKLYLTGDLAFYAMVLGKENSDTYHCPYCLLSKAEWQSPDHEKGELWTIQKLQDMVKKAKQFTKASDRPKAKGVKEDPHWPSIDPENYIIPILHLSIGLGNYVIKAMLDWINLEIVEISEEEVVVRNTLSTTMTSIAEKRKERDEWDASLQGKPELNRLERALPNLKWKVNEPGISEEEKAKREEELADAEDRMNAMAAHRKDLAKTIERLARQETKLKKDLSEHKRKRTAKENSIESKIEDVFKKRHAQRQAYHGGDFNGVDIRRIMADAEKIFEEIGEVLVRNGRAVRVMTGRHVRERCRDYGDLMTLLDGAFSKLRLADASEDDCNAAAQYMSKAMEQWRGFGFSVTPKAHILEDHAVDQMLRLGGIGDYLEDFIELSHQSGKRSEVRTKGLINFEQRHKSQMQGERRRTDVDVQQRIAEVNDSGRKRRADAIAREADAQKVKDEKRQRALNGR